MQYKAKRRQQEPIWLKIIRILLAALFLYSGFSKAVDPIGFSYNIADYFFSFKLGFLEPFALYFAVLPILAEFTLGFMLLFRVRVNFTTIFYLLFMIFFFFLTLWLALAEHLEVNYGYNFGVVHDCGCFGSAIKMTNLATFIKNLVIMIPTLIVFVKRKRIPDIRLTVIGQWCFASIGAIVVSIIMFSCYRNLPIVYDAGWKKKANIAADYIERPAVVEMVFVYQNNLDSTDIKTLTTEQLSSITDKIPTFFEGYTFIERKDTVLSPAYVPEKTENHGFNMLDSLGADHAPELINEKNPNNVYIVFMHDLFDTSPEGVEKLLKWIHQLSTEDAQIAAVTNSTSDEIVAFVKTYHFPIPVYQNPIDPVKGPFIVRDAVRGNPGVILLRSGKVIDKWNWRQLK